MTWQRSRCDSATCVEVLPEHTGVLIRSSLDRATVARLTWPEWLAMLDVIREGHGDQGPYEIADGPDAGIVVRFTVGEWTAFVAAVRAGEYDRMEATA